MPVCGKWIDFLPANRIIPLHSTSEISTGSMQSPEVFLSTDFLVFKSLTSPDKNFPLLAKTLTRSGATKEPKTVLLQLCEHCWILSFTRLFWVLTLL